MSSQILQKNINQNYTIVHIVWTVEKKNLLFFSLFLFFCFSKTAELKKKFSTVFPKTAE